MRAREGAALCDDLRAHLSSVDTALEAARTRAPLVVEVHRERLRARVARLLADGEVALDSGRIEHEVALFADRADVAEELARLGSHCDQLRDLLSSEDQSAGKRIDFLLQEMSREANTIGSKSADTALSRLVIDMKASISRMREQAQNVL